MYWRLVITLWAVLGVIALALRFLYGFQHSLCDAGTCPHVNWLTPMLWFLTGLGVVDTAFVWYLRRRDHEDPDR